MYFFISSYAWTRDNCVDDVAATIAYLKTVQKSHPGAVLDELTDTLTWKSSKAIANSLVYNECAHPELILTKHVGIKKLSETQVLSAALAMGNTFLDEQRARTLQYAVFRNQLQHHSDNDSEFYELRGENTLALLTIEYNPEREFVRLTLSE